MLRPAAFVLCWGAVAKQRAKPKPAGDRAMPAKAAAYFALYVGMGPGRSLRSLASILVERGYYKTATTALRMLNTWSVEFRWQERLSAAITARTEDALAKAAEIDAQSFARTSELIADRLAVAEPDQLDAVLKIREAVRKPDARSGAATVNLNLSVTLRSIVERVAAEQGLDPAEVLAEADRILAEAP